MGNEFFPSASVLGINNDQSLKVPRKTVDGDF